LFSFPLFFFLRKYKIYDKPKERSVHKAPVLQLGGLLFLFAYLTGLACLYLFHPQLREELLSPQVIIIISGGLLILFMGILDDIKGIGAKAKLVAEIIIALGITLSGITMDGFHIFGYFIPFGFLTIPLTIFWIISIINMINLVDGLDGLAGGICLIIFFTIFIMKPSQISVLSVMNVSLMAGLVVFLRYNFHPAQIFMGDTGSLFLGYHIAIFSLTLANFKTATVGIFLPFLLLGLPILDTTSTILRRAWNGKAIFQADKSHIHHRLLSFGMEHGSVVRVLLALSTILASLAYVGNAIKTEASGALIFCAGALLCLLFYLLYATQDVFRRGKEQGEREAMIYLVEKLHENNKDKITSQQKNELQGQKNEQIKIFIEKIIQK
jgi:UDP-GlcNAc:undecaprenyl-phosphate GlcNAc-1-phosphate transferase